MTLNSHGDSMDGERPTPHADLRTTRSKGTGASKTSHRYHFLDSLRGLAALAVVVYHCYHGGSLYKALSSTVPGVVDVVLSHGWLGVQVFFVLSGFVICHSIRRADITVRFVGVFALRRSVRLDPPYWTAIVALIAVNAASNLLFADRVAATPSWQTLLAHVCYLQNILGYGDLIPVFWTLCYEVQFYLLFIILVGLMRRISGRTAADTISFWQLLPHLVLAGLSLRLLLSPTGGLKGWGIHVWYMFFAGYLLQWTLSQRVSRLWCYAYAGVLLMTTVVAKDAACGTVLVTGIAIFVAGNRSGLETWLKKPLLLYLGRISYSLYLIHVIVGGKIVNLGRRVSGESSLAAWGWFLLAVGASILAAHILHRLVEAPSLRLGSYLKQRLMTRPGPVL